MANQSDTESETADQRGTDPASEASVTEYDYSNFYYSSSDDLFKSLPQLNENATELKSFLPNRENDKEK